MEVSGRMGRDVPADVRNVEELGFPPGIVRSPGPSPQPFPRAARERDHGVHGDRHRPSSSFLCVRLRVVLFSSLPSASWISALNPSIPSGIVFPSSTVWPGARCSMNSVKMPCSYAVFHSPAITANIFSTHRLPLPERDHVSAYARRVSSSTLNQIFSRQFRMSRSCMVWQQSSGNVESLWGPGPVLPRSAPHH